MPSTYPRSPDSAYQLPDHPGRTLTRNKSCGALRAEVPACESRRMHQHRTVEYCGNGGARRGVSSCHVDQLDRTLCITVNHKTTRNADPLIDPVPRADDADPDRRVSS